MAAWLFIFWIFIIALVGWKGIKAMMARFGGWAKAYHRLGKRYGARITYSFGKPRMSFDYGTAPCTLKSISARRRANRRTQLQVKWIDRRLKLFVSSLGDPKGMRLSRNLQAVDIDNQLEDDRFVVYSSHAALAEQMLTSAARWQVRQLIHHFGNSGIEILINRGQMKISKPGYIKECQQLDDFVRFSLDLFDQFKLAYNNDIEFLADSNAVVVEDVTCPICSGQINDDMVVCVRCKTPHCVDCWEYNGGCATFACAETRCFPAGGGNGSVPGRSGSVV